MKTPADPHGAAPEAERPPDRRADGLALARTGTVGCLLLVAYYTLPIDRSFSTGTLVALVLGLALVLALLVWHTRQTLRSERPVMRAVSALLTTVPLFVLCFATTYYLLERSVPDSFNVPMTRTDALYFTVTTLSTVGFGDIAAHSETARLLTTGQIIVDLVFLGVALRILVSAVQDALVRSRNQRPRPEKRTDAQSPLDSPGGQEHASHVADGAAPPGTRPRT